MHRNQMRDHERQREQDRWGSQGHAGGDSRWHDQQNDDRQGMGQRGDAGSLGRPDHHAHYERGYHHGMRDGYERGLRESQQRGGYDRGVYGGYGREYDQRGSSQRMGGHDEGRFGGSPQDAYDHGEHPRHQHNVHDDEGYGRARREDYDPTVRPGHANAHRSGDEDERYHGSSGRNYDQDWYGRASASPWNAWGRNRY